MNTSIEKETGFEKLFTIKEVADYLIIKDEIVRRYIREGKLKAVKINGKEFRIKKSAISEFMTNMEQDKSFLR